MIAVLNTIAGSDRELFTAFHGIFSLFRGAAIISIGPIGVLLLKISPEIRMDKFAIGKYKVGCIFFITLHWLNFMLRNVVLDSLYISYIDDQRSSHSIEDVLAATQAGSQTAQPRL